MSKRQRTIFFGIITALVVLMIVFIGWHFHRQLTTLFAQFNSRSALIDRFQRHQPIDMLTFTLLLIIVILLPGAPVSVFAIAAGVCFGHWTALVLNAIAITVGNFSVASLLPEIWHHPSQHSTGRLYQDLLKIRHPSLGIVLGYAIPFVPSTVINLAAKRLIHSRARLIVLCFIGSLPTSALYAFGGDLALRGDVKHLIFVILLAILLFGLGWVIHHDRHKEATLN
ncbi:VTT domain-containing protein [Lactobacillus sp. LC28-10]|uniref:VTT domain-containing protein n=1 Tax=Secundilactobacillus angelensis TaxID=2722706 RepID=A0ABX1L228_9LACO|nr:VTT domain-containing protein [Secundilactobacillus angelensis]MCH5463034.1 VTT domain-containing protein [Secundilactobacillus angelensis]NLR19500.1 VTT domain-containing protein [Secundilactobacillus angelensis]